MLNILRTLVSIVALYFLSFDYAWADPAEESGREVSQEVQLDSPISEQQAVELADKYVKNRSWGEHSAIMRTVSNWYRIEYGKDSNEVPRFVLVEPIKGNVEDPMPR